MAKKTKKNVPEILRNMSELNTFQEILNHFGIHEMVIDTTVDEEDVSISYCEIVNNKVSCYKTDINPEKIQIPEDAIFINGFSTGYSTSISSHDIHNLRMSYLDEDGSCWICACNMDVTFKQIPHYYEHLGYRNTLDKRNFTVCSFEIVGSWENDTIFHEKFTNEICLNSKKSIDELFMNKYPYWLKYIKEKSYDVYKLPRFFWLNPQLEMLCKAEYAFAINMCENVCAYPRNRFCYYDKTEMDRYNRLCKKGKSVYEILQVSKPVAKIIKNCTSRKTLDVVRKMDKFKRANPENIERCVTEGFMEDELASISDILKYKYDNKSVFTFDSLINYLGRLDIYEAIERKEALMLLKDYLSMCNQLGIKPRVDGDSLKREHDIAARLCRLQRDETMKRKMEGKCNFADWDYKESIFFVRRILSYDDLLDEANQQHNCVASYAKYIISGSKRIYVMRSVHEPDKSLITIELSKDGSTIHQKYLAYNRPIRNKAQSEFIERWLKYIKDVKNGIIAPQSAEKSEDEDVYLATSLMFTAETETEQMSLFDGFSAAV